MAFLAVANRGQLLREMMSENAKFALGF